ncbi:hypothetical protein V1519DRAFT_446574 [Lipomyces tetrasporus]
MLSAIYKVRLIIITLTVSFGHEDQFDVLVIIQSDSTSLGHGTGESIFVNVAAEYAVHQYLLTYYRVLLHYRV